MRLFIFFIIGILPLSTLSQNIISGYVVDSTKTGIQGATITYSKINGSVILGFSQTDKEGKFTLSIQSIDDSVVLNIKHIGYEGKTIQLQNKTKAYSFTLKTKVTELPSVVVTQTPVYKRKDTVNYNVGAFTSTEDRVIGDVIKKLPGIEIENGKILYQGKPIQKYFINGLDLLEGRYGLANDNLPVGAVQKVQIIENDQPVKILDSLVFSNRASLNIQLKKFTTTGTGKVGIGLSPALWDVNLTPMTFNRTFQAINSFQYNNVGNDVAKQLNTLTTDNIFDMPNTQELKIKNTVSFSDIQPISTPEFDEKRWLDNRISMFSSNILQKLKDNTELKGNFSYINDHKINVGQTNTSLFTPDQTINITRQINNGYNTNELQGNLILLKNEKSIYLKNDLSVIKKWDNDMGNILQNGLPIDQKKMLQDINLSNRFTTINFLGKQLVTFNSFISFSKTPQNLSVKPGQYRELLNDSMAYDKTGQNIGYNKFTTDNYISLIKEIKGITFIPRGGVFYQTQSLNSWLSVIDSNVNRVLGKDFTNDLSLQNINGYVDIKSQYKNSRWRIEINTPLTLRGFLIKDKTRNISNQIERVTFEPRGFVAYQMSSYWEANASSDYNKEYGGITALYSGYLLTSYNNLQKFNATIPQSTNWNSNLSFRYKNILKATFANISYSFFQKQNNYLFSNIIDSSGFNTIEMTNTRNKQITHSLSGEYSKYFLKLKTIFKINANASFSKAGYLLNEQLSSLKSENYSASININNSSFKFLSFSYDIRFAIIKSRLSNVKMDNIYSNNHLLKINISPIKNNTLTLRPEYYVTNLKTDYSQLFVDLQYRFSLPKRKIDFEIGGLNLLNNKTYVRFYNSEYSIVRNYYQLRPRQLTVAIRFKF